MTEMGDALHTLVELQRGLQKHLHGGVEPSEFAAERRSEYIRGQIIGLQAELFEALDEVAWKPWAKDTEKFHRDSFIRELVDAQHFLFNLFLVAGADAEEIARVYQDKQAVNRKRHAAPGKYASDTHKCPCGRALDDYSELDHFLRLGVVYHSANCEALIAARKEV